MKFNSSLIAAAVVMIAAASASAAVNISSGTAGSQSVFQQPGGGSGTPFAASSVGNGTYFTNGPSVATTNPDQLFYYNWFYQLPFRNNRAFSYVDTPIDTNVGNVSTVTYTNAGDVSAGSGRINATFTFTLTDGAQPGASRLDVVAVIQSSPTNTAASATYDFINVIDLDLNATATDDIHTASFSNGTFTATVTDTTTTNKISQRAVITADGVSRVQIGSGTTLRAIHGTNGTTTDLSNSTTSFTGDGAAAFQYQLTLAPGEIRTLNSSIEFFAVPEPTTLAAVGAAAGFIARRRRNAR